MNNRQEQHKNAPSPSGGVAILVKNEIFQDYNVEIIDKSYDGILGIKCTHKVSNFTAIIFACYLPPQNSPWGRDSSSFFAHLISEIYLVSYADFIICGGDINARIGDLKYYDENIDIDIPPRKPIDFERKGHYQDFLDFLKDSLFTVINGSITPEYDNFTNVKRGKSVVDYMFCPHDCIENVLKCKVDLANELVNECSVNNLIGTRSKAPDHSMITTSVKWCHDSNNPDLPHNPTFAPSDTTGRKCYSFKNLTPDSLKSETWTLALQNIIDRLSARHAMQTELDALYDSFCKSLFKELDESLGFRFVSKKCKKRFKNHKPYWNDHLLELWRNMVQAEKEFTRYKGQNRGTRNILFRKHVSSQTTFDRELRSASRRYNKEKVNEIETICVNNHNDFWGQIKKLGPRKQNSIPMTVRTPHGITSDRDAVLNKWESDFSDLLNRKNDNNSYNDEFYNECMSNKSRMEENCTPSHNDHLLNANITLAEVNKIVSKLKLRKACGIDFIPNEVLKCKSVVTFLHIFFQTCFDSGCVPSIWQKSIIKPIPKSSDKDPYLPLSYRGISLISCVSKAYSSLLNDRIVQFCNENNIFPDEQNGFRAKRSCEDHIYSLSSIIKNRINDKKDTFCAFVDLEKAFDWVNRNLLLYRLIGHNIQGKMYNAVKSILSNTKSCVQLESDSNTNWFNNICGVRQGDSLSPTLFSLYVNDLVKTLKEKGPLLNIGGLLINILLYADDMVLMADNESDLQELLDILYDWCAKWRLSLNRDKTQIVHFRPSGQNMSKFVFLYGRDTLRTVSKYKYLGIIFDEYLKFDECVKTISISGGRALGGIISKFKSFKNVGYNTFSKLYVAGVVPVLEYAAGVWGYVKGDEIQYIQNRAMRYFLGVHRFCPIAGMQGDMGWATPKLNRFLPIVRLWNRLLLMSDDRLTKKIFHWDYAQRNGWGKEVSKIFNEMGLRDTFSNKQFCDLRTVKSKITDLMARQWKAELEQKPKLRTYKLFKNEFKTSNSVFICNRAKRSLLSKFRTGILPLRIETGRWYQGTRLEDRVCEICGNGEIEDESHFLLKCNAYEDFRRVLFRNCSVINHNFSLLNDTEKLIYIVNCQERDLANYILYAWNRRRNFLYM